MNGLVDIKRGDIVRLFFCIVIINKCVIYM